LRQPVRKVECQRVQDQLPERCRPLLRSAHIELIVTKPFSPRELVARVRAVLRRTEKRSADADRFRAGDVVIDVPRMRITRGEVPIELTPTEFQIVATLASHAGRVFTRTQLLDAVSGSSSEAFDRAVDSHIKNIRKKLGAHYIQSVYGIGYRFIEA